MVLLSETYWSTMNNAEAPNGAEPTEVLDVAETTSADAPVAAPKRRKVRVAAGVAGVLALAQDSLI